MSISWARYTLSVTVSVYEKNGLKRGAGITSAVFRSPSFLHQDGPTITDGTCRIEVTGGGPLGTPLYQVRVIFMNPSNNPDPGITLEVSAGRHYPERYFVSNGQVFEARLQRY